MDDNDIEALWSLKFGTIDDSGAGVTVFETERIFGGDSFFFWTGHFKIKDGKITARVRVERHREGGSSVLPFDLYDMDITGKMEGDIMRAEGTVVNHPEHKAALIFEKLTPLP